MTYWYDLVWSLTMTYLSMITCIRSCIIFAYLSMILYDFNSIDFFSISICSGSAFAAEFQSETSFAWKNGFATAAPRGSSRNHVSLRSNPWLVELWDPGEGQSRNHQTTSTTAFFSVICLAGDGWGGLLLDLSGLKGVSGIQLSAAVMRPDMALGQNLVPLPPPEWKNPHVETFASWKRTYAKIGCEMCKNNVQKLEKGV